MAKCKYPNEVCANMTMFHGVAYCDTVPCQLRDELPKQTNADYIRSMSYEELANLINDPSTYGFNCGMCPLNPPYGECIEGNCYKQILEWLKKERDEVKNDKFR